MQLRPALNSVCGWGILSLLFALQVQGLWVSPGTPAFRNYSISLSIVGFVYIWILSPSSSSIFCIIGSYMWNTRFSLESLPGCVINPFRVWSPLVTVASLNWTIQMKIYFNGNPSGKKFLIRLELFSLWLTVVGYPQGAKKFLFWEV